MMTELLKKERSKNIQNGDGVGERQEMGTKGGKAGKRTIPSSYDGECPGYK